MYYHDNVLYYDHNTIHCIMVIIKRYKGIWYSVWTLLGKTKIKELPFITDDFLQFFEGKVDDIRRRTESAVESTYSPSPGCHFNEFLPISPDDVIKVISAAPNKQLSLTSWPTWLLKECITDVSSFIATVCNLSMSTGQVPSSLKKATSRHS